MAVVDTGDRDKPWIPTPEDAEVFKALAALHSLDSLSNDLDKFTMLLQQWGVTYGRAEQGDETCIRIEKDGERVQGYLGFYVEFIFVEGKFDQMGIFE